MSAGGTGRTGVLTTAAGGQVVLRRVRVRVVSGEARGQELLLDGGTRLLGSHPDADLVLPDRAVSRRHAELSLLTEGVRVRDLGSTNGTFVGNARIETATLLPGVELRCGRTRLELLPDDVPAPMPPSERTRFGKLVGESPVMRRVFAVLDQAAESSAPLLVEGEAGTGKSEAARAVHELSERGGGPLAAIDLSTVAPEGVAPAFASAAGGTVVLDRIDEAAAAVATEVVAALDRRERGELDVRPVACSRSDLRRCVEAGTTPRDLYFHVAAVRVVLPALRERAEDVPRLVRDLAGELGLAAPRAADLAALDAGELPGNVRQLRRLVEQAAAAATGAREAPGEDTDPQQIAPRPEDFTDLPFKEAKRRLVEAFERRYVADLLDRHDGNVSQAAREAGLDRGYLAGLADKHGLR